MKHTTHLRTPNPSKSVSLFVPTATTTATFVIGDDPLRRPRRSKGTGFHKWGQLNQNHMVCTLSCVFSLSICCSESPPGAPGSGCRGSTIGLTALISPSLRWIRSYVG
ncbi:hypothetical protein NL676_024688 [Syzygium grande]|nr:hypothetical protein NL676_024688 [Syzygium grande]